MDCVNQTTTWAAYGASIAKSLMDRWNTMRPILGSYLTQAGRVIPEDILNRSASTLGECTRQAGHFAIPLAVVLASKVVVLCKFAWSLAAAHPIIATSLILTFVAIPAFREYCAANERSTRRLIPLGIIWMIITRPFRLACRMLREITGTAEVDRLRQIRRLTVAQRRISHLLGTNDQLGLEIDRLDATNDRLRREAAQSQQANARLQEQANAKLQEQANARLQEIVSQLRDLGPTLRGELQVRQQAVIDEIAGIGNEEIRGVLNFVTNEILATTDEIIQNPSILGRSPQWRYLQHLVESDLRLESVKNSLSKWEKCLGLCSAGQ
ncbi:MAG: hypothetical protein LBS22_00585 [Puniceicoccales bacterium]|jgi:F0F1-type ATP synthase membrane subunit b/b'|nr:hypothetical protein [Puniceicoccales bacterium]